MPQGIQDNNTQKVDLIYTKRGRFLKSINSPEGKITKFALSDDGVDYRLYNENATDEEKALKILRTPQLESFTSENGMMRNKLISLQRDTTETTGMDVEPSSLVFEVDPQTTSRVISKAITIRAGFPAPNGFIVSLDNAEYVYIENPPANRIEDPFPDRDNRFDDRFEDDRFRDDLQRDDDRIRDERIRQPREFSNDELRDRDYNRVVQNNDFINSHIKGDKKQKKILGKNNSAPNEAVVNIYYSDRYKKFTENNPVVTRLLIESIDGGYSEEVEIQIKQV